MNDEVPGTEGYAQAMQKFIEATTAIGFTELHQDFLPFMPRKPSRVLDLGAGIGRDASLGLATCITEPGQLSSKYCRSSHSVTVRP